MMPLTEALVVGGSALAVVLSQKFVRNWWFKRQNFRPDFIGSVVDEIALCPVDGTVVYLKEVKDGKVTTEKQGRVIEEDWVGRGNGVLIGIYMSVYDRHFVISPVSGMCKVEHKPTTANIPMMDLWEYINFYYVGKFVDWFEEKAFDYKLKNEKIIYKYLGGIRMIGIADKFVNKIEVPKNLGDSYSIVRKSSKIGHIRRGSQVDLFIPEQMFKQWSYDIQVGKKVKVGQLLCFLKKENQ